MAVEHATSTQKYKSPQTKTPLQNDCTPESRQERDASTFNPVVIVDPQVAQISTILIDLLDKGTTTQNNAPIISVGVSN